MPESRRLKFIVSYDGRGFVGWQHQANAVSVQETLEQAFAKVADCPVRVTGSGRTDAGVHALAQCAHADVPAGRFAAERWVSAINGVLPPSIRVLRAQFVANSFHARFSAKEKIYRYRIIDSAIMPPLEIGRAWQVRAELEDAILRRALTLFVGKHDFTGFSANRGKPDGDTVRTIVSAKMRRWAGALELEFAGDGFLYKMVRLMVGAAVRCATGKDSLATIVRSLRQPTRSGPRLVAPAEGLYLVRVRY
ncbi:MAG: tRNA pseudouridine(38-40) synthase TruA [Verrucomicrobiota bacterium]|nr:tRNA pseudouridine(38-40) synthase TruA [Verrucomicrobiota bacterium]